MATDTAPADPGRALLERWGDIAALEAAAAVLGWDQETYMPPKGQPGRGRTLSALAGLAHGKLTDPALADALAAAEVAAHDPTGELAAQVREARRTVLRANAVPADLARRMAEVQSRALASWQQARAEGDFGRFAPDLRETVALAKEKADCYVTAGLAERPYDALLDEYEPGTTEAALVPLLASLRADLAPLVQAAADSGVVVDESPCRGSFPEQAQRAFAVEVATAMGYDFEAGRLDASAHPFTTSFDPADVRITWRWEDGDWRPGLFGVMHEAGHGLYEQGLPAEWAGTPIGAAVSLGVHESQSRLWENLVGRSRPFWTWAAPRLAEHLGVAAEPDAIWPALHTVQPSLIRVEADEATYNLHVVVRFEIERALFAGEVDVDDLPDRWDDTYAELLGIRPDSVSDGVLQDIHWSMGAFGYFPTYTLGNLLAAQLFEAAGAAIGDLDDRLAAGDLAPLLDWLRTNVHRHASRLTAPELIEQATGGPLRADALLRHLRATTEAVYGAA
ncbi:MAG: carboxypeptidase M32 [Acidimicrobiales bacterium]